MENQGLSPSTSKTNSMSLDLDVEEEDEEEEGEDGFEVKVVSEDEQGDEGFITTVDARGKGTDSRGFKEDVVGHGHPPIGLNKAHEEEEHEREEEEDQTIQAYPISSAFRPSDRELSPPSPPRTTSLSSSSPTPNPTNHSVGLGLHLGASPDNHINNTPLTGVQQGIPGGIRRRGSSLPSSDPLNLGQLDAQQEVTAGKQMTVNVPPLMVVAPTPIIDQAAGGAGGMRLEGKFEDVHLPGVESGVQAFEHRDLKTGDGLEEGLTYPIMMNGIYDTLRGEENYRYAVVEGRPGPSSGVDEGTERDRPDLDPPSPFSQPIRLGETDRSISASSGLSVSTFESNGTARGPSPSPSGSGVVRGDIDGSGSGKRFPLGLLHSPSAELRAGRPGPGSGSGLGLALRGLNGNTSPSLGSRKMSRKQAPILTESLENLALGAGSEVTLPSLVEGSGSGMSKTDFGSDEFGNQMAGGLGDRGSTPTPTQPGRLFTVYPDPALIPDGEERGDGLNPSVWLKDHSLEKSPTSSFSRLARIGSRGGGGGARSPSSSSTGAGLPASGSLTGRTIPLGSSSGSYTTASGRRASAGGIEPVGADGIAVVEGENKKRHSSFLGLGAGNVGFGVRRKSEAGLIEGSSVLPPSAPVESPRKIKPARVLSPRLLTVPLITRHKPSTRNGQEGKPPVIPTRQDSLPVDPASPRAVLGNHPSGVVPGPSGLSSSTTQLPLDHFLFGQTRGDVISTVTSNDARRPSEQTFMTGYSLGGGAIASTDDETHGPAGIRGGPSKTIDLGDESDDGRGFTSPLPPVSSARASTADMLQPTLFTRVSASTVTAATATTAARPRDDLPFGVLRKDLTPSGPPTPSVFLTDGFSTPRPGDLTPSSSFLRKDRPNVMYSNEMGEHSKRSIKSTTVNRRPVQWAELDALEEEEAKMRAELRREERSRRVEEKKERKKVKRQGLAKKLAGGTRTGYSTDTSSDGTKSKREGFRERRARLKQESEVFDALKDTIPGYDDLMAASMIQVRDETGAKVEFGQLISSGLGKRYVVIFIRHWYCPLCAQYTESIIRTIDQEALDRANVELIIIGNGSYKMIPGYSKSIRCPFKMYTDSKLKLYRALGMTRQTGDAGDEDEKGDYIRMSTLESTWEVAKRASKMPIKNPG